VPTVAVTVSFTADPSKFFVGGTVTAQIVTQQTGDVLQVPARAITTASDGTTTVLVSTDGSTTNTKQVTVVTGINSGGQIQITSGLAEGDQVVVRRGFGGGGGTGGAGTGAGGGTRGTPSSTTQAGGAGR